ncbi:MAG TPA: aldo/keto reductase [Candidatus Saccharimonadales bacterium]|nr:aldo/keto reductase [Candidatus Saccharimonadales bacterium]
METIRLNSGVDMPCIGFGTWELSRSEALSSVAVALQTGYRLIDTAKIYGNEDTVGQAIMQSGVARKDIFVTTKLWNDDQSYDAAFQALDASLERLGLDYVDLYLIHWPATRKRGEAWKALVDLQKAGKTKAIGVSNYTIDHLTQLLGDSDTIPAVNQVEFHPYIYEQQRELLEYCKQKGITIEAYSPLARVSKDAPSQVNEIAGKLGKTEQQVFLRWCIQHGTIPLPRSRDPEHIASNFDVFDFELSDEDMNQLNNISDGDRVTWDPAGMGS